MYHEGDASDYVSQLDQQLILLTIDQQFMSLKGIYCVE